MDESARIPVPYRREMAVMPLVRIMLHPRADIMLNTTESTIAKHSTIHTLIKVNLPQSLPAMLVNSPYENGLKATTPVEGVEVTCGDYSQYDVNVPSIGFRIEYTSRGETQEHQRQVRDGVLRLLEEWFVDHDLVVNGLALDIFWMQSSGFLSLDGTEVSWP